MATSRSLLLLLFVTLLRMHHPCNGLEQLDAPKDDSPLIRRRLHGGGVHREFFCSLDHIEITQIAKNETVAKLHDVNGTTNATTTTNSPQNTYAAKACACYSGFLNSTYYCPADSNYCSILVAYDYQYTYIASRIDEHAPTVKCFRDTQLKGFARYVWKYCTIILAALFLVLMCTDTGRVSMKYQRERKNYHTSLICFRILTFIPFHFSDPTT